MRAGIAPDDGFVVCDMFQSAPDWTRRIAKLPGDFAALFRFSADCARELDATDAWEFWNEEIEGFAPEPAWDFAAAMKAAALGFRAGNPGVLVLNGSLCKSPGNDYDRLLYENEIGKYTVVRNVHAYLPLSLYSDRIGKMRDFAETTGEGGKAMWLTELGTMALGPGMLPGRNRAERTFSPEQEILNAEFFPKSQVLAAMEGVDRSYYFVFAAYSEDGGKKEFSIIRRNGTPMPTFAAIATMTDKLAGFSLVGELDAPEGVRAFLYEDWTRRPGERAQTDLLTPNGVRDDVSRVSGEQIRMLKQDTPRAASQTVLFWSESDLDFATREKPVWRLDGLYERGFAIPAPDGEYTLTDLCGTPSRVVAENGTLRLQSIRYPQYVEGLRGLVAAKPAKPRGRPIRYTPAPDEDLTVVIRAEVSKDDFVIGGIKSVARLLAPEGRIAFEVWNLSKTPKRGHLRCLSGGTLTLPDGDIELPPMGMVRVEATYAPSGESGAPGGRALPDGGVSRPGEPIGADLRAARILRVDGVFDGKRSTSIVIPVEPMGDFLATCEAVDVGAGDPANWTRNDSADEYACERIDGGAPGGRALPDGGASRPGEPVGADRRAARSRSEDDSSASVGADRRAARSRSADDSSASVGADRRAARSETIQFRVQWNAKADKWFYPKLQLRPEGGMAGAEFLVFEAKSEQPGRANSYVTQNYWLDTADGRSARHDLPPTGTEWTTYRIPLRQPVDPETGAPKFAPEDVTAIRLGGNPHNSELLFWIRNVRVLKAKP